VKKTAGKRSALKRSSRYALVIKKHWLNLILSGEKTWEIRGSSTTRRGWIHLAESRAGGKLIGRARLVDCRSLSASSFMSYESKHRVADLSDVPYKTIFAWVLQDAQRFKNPLLYSHRPGAVIWVKV
jgi:hypothetical protein